MALGTVEKEGVMSMGKNTINKKYGRLVVVLFLVVCLMFSAAQALLVSTDQLNDFASRTSSLTPPPLLQDNYYTWEDLFTDSTKVDPSMSYNYEITAGGASMKDTFPLWTDPAWTRMKQVTITNNAGEILYDYALQLLIPYDADMRPDYGDLRFKHEGSGDVILNYWVETYDASSASVWVKIPYAPIGTSKMYLFYGNPAATDQSDFYGVFTAWEEYWPNDEQITYHGTIEGAWDPDVSFGNNDFLVAWEEGQAYYPPYTWGYKQELRASMYDSEGARVVFDNLVYQDDTVYYQK